MQIYNLPRYLTNQVELPLDTACHEGSRKAESMSVTMPTNEGRLIPANFASFFPSNQLLRSTSSSQT